MLWEPGPPGDYRLEDEAPTLARRYFCFSSGLKSFSKARRSW